MVGSIVSHGWKADTSIWSSSVRRLLLINIRCRIIRPCSQKAAAAMPHIDIIERIESRALLEDGARLGRRLLAATCLTDCIKPPGVEDIFRLIRSRPATIVDKCFSIRVIGERADWVTGLRHVLGVNTSS